LGVSSPAVSARASLRLEQELLSLLSQEATALRRLHELTVKLCAARQADFLRLERGHTAAVVDLLRARAELAMAREAALMAVADHGNAAADAWARRVAELSATASALLAKVVAARRRASALRESRAREVALRDLLSRARPVFESGDRVRLHPPMGELQRRFEEVVCAPSAREGRLLASWLRALGPEEAAPAAVESCASVSSGICTCNSAWLPYLSPNERRFGGEEEWGCCVALRGREPENVVSDAATPSPLGSQTRVHYSPSRLHSPVASSSSRCSLRSDRSGGVSASASTSSLLSPSPSSASLAPPHSPLPTAQLSPGAVLDFTLYFARLVAKTYRLSCSSSYPAEAPSPLPALALYAARLVFSLLFARLFPPIRAQNGARDAALVRQQRWMRLLPDASIAGETGAPSSAEYPPVFNNTGSSGQSSDADDFVSSASHPPVFNTGCTSGSGGADDVPPSAEHPPVPNPIDASGSSGSTGDADDLISSASHPPILNISGASGSGGADDVPSSAEHPPVLNTIDASGSSDITGDADDLVSSSSHPPVFNTSDAGGSRSSSSGADDVRSTLAAASVSTTSFTTALTSTSVTAALVSAASVAAAPVAATPPAASTQDPPPDNPLAHYSAADDASFHHAVGALSELSYAIAPADALLCLLRAVRYLHQSASRATGTPVEAVGADLLQPLLVLAVVHAELPSAFSCVAYVSRFCGEELANSELGYYLASLEAALTYIVMTTPVMLGADAAVVAVAQAGEEEAWRMDEVGGGEWLRTEESGAEREDWLSRAAADGGGASIEIDSGTADGQQAAAAQPLPVRGSPSVAALGRGVGVGGAVTPPDTAAARRQLLEFFEREQAMADLVDSLALCCPLPLTERDECRDHEWGADGT